MKIKKGFLMDYKCRGNWYTAVAKSSQVKQSVNAVRVWLNMLERCLPPFSLSLCNVAKKKLGNFSAEPKSKSEHAPLSQHFGWDWDRFEVCGHFNCNGHPWDTRIPPPPPSLSLSLLAFYHKVLCTFGYPIGIPNYFAWHCNRGRSPVVSHLRLDSSVFGVHWHF